MINLNNTVKSLYLRSNKKLFLNNVWKPGSIKETLCNNVIVIFVYDEISMIHLTNHKLCIRCNDTDSYFYL